jgi:hypothetical protein
VRKRDVKSIFIDDYKLMFPEKSFLTETGHLVVLAAIIQSPSLRMEEGPTMSTLCIKERRYTREWFQSTWTTLRPLKATLGLVGRRSSRPKSSPALKLLCFGTASARHQHRLEWLGSVR